MLLLQEKRKYKVVYILARFSRLDIAMRLNMIAYPETVWTSSRRQLTPAPIDANVIGRDVEMQRAVVSLCLTPWRRVGLLTSLINTCILEPWFSHRCVMKEVLHSRMVLLLLLDVCEFVKIHQSMRPHFPDNFLEHGGSTSIPSFDKHMWN